MGKKQMLKPVKRTAINANPLDNILVLDKPQEHLLVVMKEGRVHTSRWSKVVVEVEPPEHVIE